MRGISLLASGLVGALLTLGVLWINGAAWTRETRAEETGTIAGWVYWGTPAPYGSAVPGLPAPGPATPAQPAPEPTAPNQPAQGDVDPSGELPPPAPPNAPQPGAAQPNGPRVPICDTCSPAAIAWAWPVPVQGALVAVQGTSLSATTDEDGWFMIEGVPLNTYYTVAATLPPGAKLAPAAPSGQAPAPVPSIRGVYAVRTNVAVKTSAKPLNIGALFVGRPYGPFPLPGQPGG
jgi:hypothetical protein